MPGRAGRAEEPLPGLRPAAPRLPVLPHAPSLPPSLPPLASVGADRLRVLHHRGGVPARTAPASPACVPWLTRVSYQRPRGLGSVSSESEVEMLN